MRRILHGINFSLQIQNEQYYFFAVIFYLCFGDKLLNYSLCLLRLMQLRKASIILCDQRDMLKWDHMLILGFREMGSVFASVPRLFQYTRKHDLFLKNSTEQNSALCSQTELCLHTGFCNMTALFSYSAEYFQRFHHLYSEQSPT